jgi:methionine synthase II (cobalamin-independent)
MNVDGFFVDGFFIDYDYERSRRFELLANLYKVKQYRTIVLGLVGSKKHVLESEESFIARIKEDEKYILLKNLCLYEQCNFVSGEEGNKLTEEQ